MGAVTHPGGARLGGEPPGVRGALRGEGALDANADGTVSFGELCTHVTKQMRELENQPADYHATEGFNAAFRLALANDLARHRRRTNA